MMRLGPGRWINRQIQLLSWLGEELYGDSFLAELHPHGRRVTVRVLHAEACRTPQYVERFRRTAELAMALAHRHAAAIYAFGMLQQEPMRSPRWVGEPAMAATEAEVGIPWIASEAVTGQDLLSLLVDGLPPAALAGLLMPVADLLDRAAAMGLEHGELSPSTLVVVPEEGRTTPRVVLLDLGLAKVQAQDPLETPLPLGLQVYRSPEQCVPQGRASPASDRYALAVVLYEAVAGRPPFASKNPLELMQAHRSAPVPPLRTLVPSLHRAPALDAFFVRALAKQPEARFPTATVMLEEFLLALGPTEQGKRPLQQRRRSPRWYRLRHRDDPEQALDVVVGPRAVLGKQPECDVVCQGRPSPQHDVITAGVSREHAVLIWLDDRLSVLDQSVNGTYVNGRRAGPRLAPVPDGALLRLGEHLELRVRLVAPAGEVAGALLSREDAYAAGVPATLMLWQKMPLGGSPLAPLGGALRLGQIWHVQRELWWSGDPSVLWQREDGTKVIGSGPLRHGDLLLGAGAAIVVEH
ncbi:MAG: FHA domain-containing serine/threonine-protein kinase [Myxococcales bacterium]|nr:FHA domain-containing protein [Myxococcota bacterium]MDW8282027.1 FHA domain-containing serine/threonine-protein kinase [Myxococcales bacterium]